MKTVDLLQTELSNHCWTREAGAEQTLRQRCWSGRCAILLRIGPEHGHIGRIWCRSTHRRESIQRPVLRLSGDAGDRFTVQCCDGSLLTNPE